MMYGPEKSDSAIVATRPTNKAGRPAAEPVERRAGTKGNVGQQSTHRTQHRTARVTGAGTHTAGCRHTPEVGAVCGKAARTDLCGGRSAMTVPTASKLLLRCVRTRFGRDWHKADIPACRISGRYWG